MASTETLTPERVLELARQLSPDHQHWLVRALREGLDNLPEQATLDQASQLYLADRCSLARAAELAGVTQWELKAHLADQGTPARAGTDYADAETMDDAAASAWAQLDGRR